MSRVVGGSQTLSKMRSRFPGAYPESLIWGSGAWVCDVYYNDYIDWSCALGAISLGYHDHGVDRAVKNQVDKGPIFSLPNVGLEERVAEQLCALVPCAEAVRFLKTGSEATEAAIRVARAHTGREIVLACGYHSWHSWYAATREHSPGVPLAMKHLVRTFKYNDLQSLDAVLDAEVMDFHAGPTGRPLSDHVAAIIMEPTLFEEPAPGFLEGVRERASRIGAVLIFDEMVTGFRWHAGGYQRLCGVTPDLATFGKGMGNGYPVAALVGRADVMRHAVLASGTFGGDCVGLAAASAVMERYAKDHPTLWYENSLRQCFPHDAVSGHMYEIGTRLIHGYNELARACHASTRMEGQPYHPRIVWDEVPITTSADRWDKQHGCVTDYKDTPNRHCASLFFQECAKRGVLFHPDGLNVSLAHGEAELEETLEVCKMAMLVTVDAVRHGDVFAKIEGDPIDPAPAWRATQ